MVNKVILIGNLGADPEVRETKSGQEVATLRLATSETWKDKQGERQERTEWHRVVIFNEGLVGVVKRYVKKGSKIYIEGALRTRKWEKDGVDQYTTEVVLTGFGSTLKMLDSKGEQGSDKPKPARQRVDIEEDFGAY